MRSFCVARVMFDQVGLYNFYLNIDNDSVNPNGTTAQKRIHGPAGGDFGLKTSSSIEILFNLQGFFEKKIPKHPLN